MCPIKSAGHKTKVNKGKDDFQKKKNWTDELQAIWIL